jgi:hypothetical protein
VLFLFIVPIAPYTLSLQIPFVLKPGSPGCGGQTPQELQACIDRYLYPPVNITGRASLSYELFGIGIQPFNSSYRIVAGNDSAIFYIAGTKITSAEDYPFPSFELNPQGVVAIQNVSITRDELGLVTMSATVENVGTQPLDKVGVLFDFVPGNSDNYTSGGITWVDGQGGFFPPGDLLMPGSSRTFSGQPQNQSVSAGQTFRYRLQVLALSGSTNIVYQKWFQGLWPATGITPNWVASFIQEVNSNRTGPQLAEDQALDAFAQTRFQTQVANYNISNYEFQQDFAKSFPGSSLQIGETTLWPGTDAPFEYATFLQESAPGHWSALTNPIYTHFGYYIGYGPTIVVSQPCSITEFPGSVNIPNLLASNGCHFTIEQTVWLVIEVGS